MSFQKKKLHFSYINSSLELVSRKLHRTYSFVIQGITWKISLRIIFLENRSSVRQKFLFFFSELIRVACLQNETAAEKLLNRYEKRFEKSEKKTWKTIRNATEKVLAPLRPLENISPALFNKF